MNVESQINKENLCMSLRAAIDSISQCFEDLLNDWSNAEILMVVMSNPTNDNSTIITNILFCNKINYIFRVSLK